MRATGFYREANDFELSFLINENFSLDGQTVKENPWLQLEISHIIFQVLKKSVYVIWVTLHFSKWNFICCDQWIRKLLIQSFFSATCKFGKKCWKRRNARNKSVLMCLSLVFFWVGNCEAMHSFGCKMSGSCTFWEFAVWSSVTPPPLPSTFMYCVLQVPLGFPPYPVESFESYLIKEGCL